MQDTERLSVLEQIFMETQGGIFKTGSSLERTLGSLWLHIVNRKTFLYPSLNLQSWSFLHRISSLPSNFQWHSEVN